MRKWLFGVIAASLALYAGCTGRTEVASTGGGGAVIGNGGGAVSDGSTTTTTSASTGAGVAAGAGGQAGEGGAGGGQALTVADCYADDFVTPLVGGPDYDQFGPVVGSHCMGTNHQNITGVERVVFLGDSVTVGTPPTLASDFYRTQLAGQLASKFNLQAPGPLWNNVDPFGGKTIVEESGDFASCAKWGARTDDLLPTQLPDCFSANDLNKRTLVILTIGGNDISSLTQDAIDGVGVPELWDKTHDFVQLQRDAVEWLTMPGRFPNGVFVVFGNMYEFTDGTGDVQSCDVSGLAGFDQPVPSPATLADMVIWANEQFVKIAVDTKTDVIFMLEDFCGHGFNADDPSSPCYRGVGSPTWFDLTCIHPNPTGHDHLTDMFMAVVNE